MSQGGPWPSPATALVETRFVYKTYTSTQNLHFNNRLTLTQTRTDGSIHPGIQRLSQEWSRLLPRRRECRFDCRIPQSRRVVCYLGKGVRAIFRVFLRWRRAGQGLCPQGYVSMHIMITHGISRMVDLRVLLCRKHDISSYLIYRFGIWLLTRQRAHLVRMRKLWAPGRRSRRSWLAIGTNQGGRVNRDIIPCFFLNSLFW